mmetsp:Transcript_20902/g.67325  ORF Transcript_20902/g.67325 Transcript_20902/m.67325 type:complete len:447 (-) Transcript_20902:187-1527(-)
MSIPWKPPVPKEERKVYPVGHPKWEPVIGGVPGVPPGLRMLGLPAPDPFRVIPREEEEEKEEAKGEEETKAEEDPRPVKKHGWPDLRRSLREFGLGLLAAFLYALAIASFPARDVPGAGPAIAVLGAMGSGTRSLATDLRRLGLDVGHEVTGKDGAVSWLHVLLFDDVDDLADKGAAAARRKKRRKALCADFVEGAWHPQNLAIDEVACAPEKGNRGDVVRRCWRQRCDAAMARWIGCGKRGDCPLAAFRGSSKETSAAPVVLVRHPLRTIESLARHFCPRNSGDLPEAQLKVISAVLGTTKKTKAKVTCVEHFARYYRDYYAVAARNTTSVVLRRETTTACDVANLYKDVDHPRLERAVHFCKSRMPSFRYVAYVLRQFVVDLKTGALLSDGALDETKLHLSWETLATALDDQPLVDDLRRLARTFGYDDHIQDTDEADLSPKRK